MRNSKGGGCGRVLIGWNHGGEVSANTKRAEPLAQFQPPTRLRNSRLTIRKTGQDHPRHPPHFRPGRSGTDLALNRADPTRSAHSNPESGELLKMTRESRSNHENSSDLGIANSLVLGLSD